ncbi:MAG: ECF transporter S component [Anaerolineales bacterium]
MKKVTPLVIAVTAIMIAVVAVFTMVARVPIPATQGYFNLSDVAIYFSAFSFGPLVGFVAGGVGAALADLLGGYPQWAILTFLAHGLEGLVAGALARGKDFLGLVVAWAVGTMVMVGLYLLGEGLVLTGWGPALTELPVNLLQNVVGGVVGIPLFYAVRRAYPPIRRLARGPEWREE